MTQVAVPIPFLFPLEDSPSPAALSSARPSAALSSARPSAALSSAHPAVTSTSTLTPTHASCASRASARYWLGQNVKRTAIALTTTLFVASFMMAMQGVSDNRSIAMGLHQQAAAPLPDLLMDWAPAWLPLHMADLLLNSFAFFTFAVFVASWRWRVQRYGAVEGHYRTFRIARRFLWMLTAAYLLRSLSILSTTMPPSDPRCTYRQRSWRELPFTGLEILTHTGNTCSDKVFSGHSSLATLIGLFWIGALYRPRKEQRVALWRKAAIALIVAWVFSVYVACVLCRNHYSIDIVVASLVCTGIFSVYQLSVRLVEYVGPAETGVKVETKAERLVESTPVITNAEHAHTAVQVDAALASHTISTAPASPVSVSMHEILSPLHHTSTGKDAESSHETLLPRQSRPPQFAQLARPFQTYLRTIAWMEGVDIRRRACICI